MKIILLTTVTSILLGIGVWYFIYNLHKTNFPNSPYFNQFSTKSHLGTILILFSSKEKIGGGKTYTINHYKSLLKNGQPAFFLTVKGAPIIQDLIKQQLPFYACNSLKISFGKFFWQPGIETAIYTICSKKKISIIHANNCREVFAAQKIAQKLPVKIVYTRHITHPLDENIIEASDGIIGVSKQVTAPILQTCTNPKFAKKEVIYIPPFLNEEAFIKFTPHRTKEQFFQELFGITIKPYPLICKIANFYADVTHKNHPLLFQALATLVHGHNLPIQVALAGDGANRKIYEQMVKNLNLKKYVYFLGNLSQEAILELLYHSNGNVLASSHEAFGIALLEASMMRKPSIIATSTGAAGEVIIHNKTGLLFENNNAEELTKAIEHLIKSPLLCKELGNNAYSHVEQHFSNQVSTAKMLAFYQQILPDKN